MNSSQRIVFGTGHRGGHSLLPEILEIGWGTFAVADEGHLVPHAHAGAFELCLILDGEVEWSAGASLEILREGDVYVSQPDEIHWGRDAAMHPCSLYWVILGSIRCGFNWGDTNPQLALELDARLREFQLHRLRSSSGIKAAFQEIFEEHRLGINSAYETLLRQGNARASLLRLLIQLVRAYDQRTTSKDLSDERLTLPPTLLLALQVLHNYAHDPQVVPHRVCETTGLKYNKLNDLFVYHLGSTLPQYWLRQRVRLAREQLLRSDKSIIDIATELGFSSSQHFATVFRKITGLTPTVYRNMVHVLPDSSA